MEKTTRRYTTLETLADQKVAEAADIATIAQLKLGSVYRVLGIFEENGYVESRTTTDGAPRRLYRLTDRGVELLEEYQEHFGPTEKLGLLSQVKQELLTAINQVWSGFFNVPVRREKERQHLP